MKAVLIGLAGHAGLLGIAAVSSFGLLSNRNIFNNQSTASLDSVSVSNSTSNCTSYAVQSGDTCETIFYKTNATYAQLLRWNPDLSPSCNNLQSLSHGLCVSNPSGTGHAISTNTIGTPSTASAPAAIPSPTGDKTTGKCGRFYQLGPNEDCGTMVNSAGITKKDFVFLNPGVGDDCSTVKTGYYYCVQPVGRIDDYPGYGSRSMPPFTPIPFKTTTGILDRLSSYTSSLPAVPTAPGTRVDCHRYSWIDTSIDDPALATCEGWAFVWDISLQDFLLWNPSLNQVAKSSGTETVTGSAPTPTSCLVKRGEKYCVALAPPTFTSTESPTPTPPSPRASGEVPACTAWYLVEKGDTCGNILVVYFLTMKQFYAMNPSIGPDCTALVIGTNYCLSTLPNGEPPSDDNDHGTPTTTTSTPVTTPTPTQSGMVNYCNKFYQVKPGDKCVPLCRANGIGLADFFKWNPGVGDACKNMQTGSYVCVGASH